LRLGQEHSHAHMCACPTKAVYEIVCRSAGSADIVYDQNLLAFDDAAYPDVLHDVDFRPVLGEVTFLTCGENIYPVEAVDGASHAAKQTGELLIPTDMRVPA